VVYYLDEMGRTDGRTAVGVVARRKRGPLDARFPRLTIEVHPEDERLVRRAKSAAVLRGESLREWFLEAIRQRLARDSEVDAGR
jgi:hypothetical protein